MSEASVRKAGVPFEPTCVVQVLTIPVFVFAEM
jgi:hypothetical protein